MRILTIIDHLGPGGRQRTAQNYAIGYHRAGHTSAVLAIEKDGPREEPLIEHGIQVFVGGVEGSPIEDAAGWQPEILHLHSEGPPRSQIAAAMHRLKGALTKRVPIVETSSFGKVDYRRRYRLTDVHLLKARWALWRWQKWSRPLSPRPIGAVVPNTIDVEAFYPAAEAERKRFRNSIEVPDDAFLFGRIGQPIVWKWSPIILEAFEEVALRHPDVYLLLVGLPEELRHRVDSLPSSIKARVREIPFLASDHELRIAYTSLDTFLHAAHIGESFGMVLAEALACECPVITQSRPSRDNSHLELVGHLRGGLVVNARNGMVQAMELLMHDANLRRHLAVQGARFVKATYTVDQVVPTLERILGHVQTSTSPTSLRCALDTDPALVTHVSDEEIDILMRTTLDPPRRLQRLQKWAIHQPVIYRPWRAVKFRNH